MADNFDLKKFLKENKSIENLNVILKKENLSEGTMRDKIREMIINELNLDINNPGKTDAEEADAYDPLYEDEDLDEAKKKEEEVADVEVTDTETTEEIPAEEAPVTGGGIEDLAADMKGTEADLMDHLMKAFQISKGLSNEKLETQVGNTLKFFVSEYIGGGNE